MVDDFEKIYREHGKTVYSFLFSLSHDEHLSEELTQETMFRAIMKFDSFRGDCKLSVWLCQIAKNLYYEWYNKNKKNTPLDEMFVPHEVEPDISVDLADKETAWQILQLLHTLDDPYKEVFMLHALGDVPLKNISQLFKKSESWARVIYYRAKNMIISKLKEDQT